ncbi:hypothetical protein FD723_40320 (plasmid) [Nostoc sp. C052]|uniref:hypothetical protein n=1 Tax=Nostoc sp. C052 TaxID=2576902 RepID=UPI0015C3DDCB|nr:hypothetical protein [Nostoc sp. C052]QLE46460.1 hypothetical protein FD723_40320 [Nostoc sp. C052]
MLGQQQDKSVKVEFTPNGFIYTYSSPGGLFETQSILGYDSAWEAEIAGLSYMRRVEKEIADFGKDLRFANTK